MTTFIPDPARQLQANLYKKVTVEDEKHRFNLSRRTHCVTTLLESYTPRADVLNRRLGEVVKPTLVAAPAEYDSYTAPTFEVSGEALSHYSTEPVGLPVTEFPHLTQKDLNRLEREASALLVADGQLDTVSFNTSRAATASVFATSRVNGDSVNVGCKVNSFSTTHAGAVSLLAWLDSSASDVVLERVTAERRVRVRKTLNKVSNAKRDTDAVAKRAGAKAQRKAKLRAAWEAQQDAKLC